MNNIRTYVQDLGGGLVMIGGDQAFGLGGYYKTTIEEILPVRSDFEKEKEKPSIAMVLVIDKSGSMDGPRDIWATPFQSCTCLSTTSSWDSAWWRVSICGSTRRCGRWRLRGRQV